MNAGGAMRNHDCPTSRTRKPPRISGTPGPATSTLPAPFPIQYPCLIAKSDGSEAKGKGGKSEKRAGYATVVRFHQSGHESKVIYQQQGPVVGTSNEAEYLGITASLLAVEAALRIHQVGEAIEHCYALTDSELVVNQLNGKYKVNNKLANAHKEAKDRKEAIEKDFPGVKLVVKHIKRKWNTETDTLAKAAVAMEGETRHFIGTDTFRRLIRKTKAAKLKARDLATIQAANMRQLGIDTTTPRREEGPNEVKQPRAERDDRHRAHAQNERNQLHPYNVHEPSEPKYDPLQHVALQYTWSEIPKVAQQAWIEKLRGLLAQYSEIPVEERIARATDTISQIVKAPVQLLSRPAKGDDTKLTKRLISKLNSGDAGKQREAKVQLAEETEKAYGEESEADDEDSSEERSGNEEIQDGAEEHSGNEENQDGAASKRNSGERRKRKRKTRRKKTQKRTGAADSQELNQQMEEELKEERHPPQGRELKLETDIRLLEYRKRRARELYRQGYRAKAVKMLLSAPLMRLTPEVIEKLRELHPEPTVRAVPKPPQNANIIIVDLELLKKIIKERLANGSARSATGWTAELLLPLIEDEVCMRGLGDIVQDIMNNNVSEDGRQILLLGKLIAVQKHGDPTTPRPVTIGDILYKAAAVYGLKLVEGALPPIFKGIQLGLGEPGGSIRAIHTIQAAMDMLGELSVLLKLDQKNGFNAAERTEMLQQAYSIESLSPIWNLLDFGYGGPSQLVVLDKGRIIASILSQQGSKQGDPLGTLLFCLYFMPKIQEITRDIPKQEHCAVAIVDDCNIVTSVWTQSIQAYDMANRILNLNQGKTKILWPHGNDPPEGLVDACRTRGIALVTGTLEALGGLVGYGDEDFEDFAVGVVDSYAPVFEMLKQPQPGISAQMSYGMLRVCVRPKFGHTLHAVPSRLTGKACAIFDKQILSTFEHIHKIKPVEEDNIKRSYVNLPLRFGGMGLTRTEDERHPAYFSAAVGASSHLQTLADKLRYGEDITPGFVVEREHAYLYLTEEAGVPTANALVDADGDIIPGALLPVPEALRKLHEFYAGAEQSDTFKLQRLISARVQKNIFQQLLDECDQRAVARFLSRVGPSAMRWASVIPNRPETTFTDREWEAVVKFQMDEIPDYGLLKCICGAEIEGDHSHFHVCQKFRKLAVNEAHDHLSFTIMRHHNRVGLYATAARRPKGLIKKVTPDIRVVRKDAKIQYGDITRRHVTARSHLSKARRPGAVLDAADKQKIIKYMRLCKRQDAMFVPLSVETYGALGKGIINQVDYLVEQAISSPLNSTFSDEDAKLLKEQMLEEISCSIQKGNAMITAQGIALAVLKNGCFNPNAARVGPLPRIPDQLNEEARKKELAKMGIDPMLPVLESDEDELTDSHGDGDHGNLRIEGGNEQEEDASDEVEGHISEANSHSPRAVDNQQYRLQHLAEQGIVLKDVRPRGGSHKDTEIKEQSDAQQGTDVSGSQPAMLNVISTPISQFTDTDDEFLSRAAVERTQAIALVSQFTGDEFSERDVVEGDMHDVGPQIGATDAPREGEEKEEELREERDSGIGTGRGEEEEEAAVLSVHLLRGRRRAVRQVVGANIGGGESSGFNEALGRDDNPGVRGERRGEKARGRGRGFVVAPSPRRLRSTPMRKGGGKAGRGGHARGRGGTGGHGGGGERSGCGRGR